MSGVELLLPWVPNDIQRYCFLSLHLVKCKFVLLDMALLALLKIARSWGRYIDIYLGDILTEGIQMMTFVNI